MAVVVVALIQAAVTVGITVFLLSNIQTIVADIKEVNSALVEGIVAPIVKAWVEVALIGAGLGLTVWLLESKIAKSQGERVAPPPVGPLLNAPPPSFGAQVGYGARAGPVSVSGGGGAASAGAPTIVIPEPPPPRGSFGESLGRLGSSGPRLSRQDRQVRRAQGRADLATAQRRETEERHRRAQVGRSRYRYFAPVNTGRSW